MVSQVGWVKAAILIVPWLPPAIGAMRVNRSYDTPTFGNPAASLVPLISSNTISSTD